LTKNFNTLGLAQRNYRKKHGMRVTTGAFSPVLIKKIPKKPFELKTYSTHPPTLYQ